MLSLLQLQLAFQHVHRRHPVREGRNAKECDYDQYYDHRYCCCDELARAAVASGGLMQGGFERI